jgi:hypothetical protein
MVAIILIKCSLWNRQLMQTRLGSWEGDTHRSRGRSLLASRRCCYGLHISSTNIATIKHILGAYSTERCTFELSKEGLASVLTTEIETLYSLSPFTPENRTIHDHDRFQAISRSSQSEG